jgi:hypothetical protein
VIDIQPFDAARATDTEIDEHHDYSTATYRMNYPEPSL